MFPPLPAPFSLLPFLFQPLSLPSHPIPASPKRGAVVPDRFMGQKSPPLGTCRMGTETSSDDGAWLGLSMLEAAVGFALGEELRYKHIEYIRSIDKYAAWSIGGVTPIHVNVSHAVNSGHIAPRRILP